MTLSLEIAVWITLCTAGLLTALGSLRYSLMILHAVRTQHAPIEVIDGTRQLFRTELERVIGWALFVGVGLLALTDDRPAPPPATVVGTLAVWLLIATVGLWSFQTVSDYLYSRKRFRAL